MSWAVGTDTDRQRHIGYGVPATCDQPGCGERIDRGMAWACGGTHDARCGLYFCSEHLRHYDENGDNYICDRCSNSEEPFEPSPDTADWMNHVLTEESWAEWRETETAWADRMRIALAEAAE